jgi:DNA-binding transcriptional ArsR family regulator
MQDSASDIFEALAHPTRRQILQVLKDGELAAGAIASRFPASGPTISRHLGVLKSAGLVAVRRDANRILYSLIGDRLALAVRDFLSSVCPEQNVLREVRNGTRSSKSEKTPKTPKTAKSEKTEKTEKATKALRPRSKHPKAHATV